MSVHELTLAGDTLAVIERELGRDPRLASGHSRRTYLGDR